MLTKEECEKALDKLARYCSDYRLCMLPPRFKLNGELELLDKLIYEHFDLQPYEFEDLHEGMWVWDDKEKLFNLIYETRINCAGEQEIEFQFTMINLDGDDFLCDIFEEGRFFPVTKALYEG